MSENEYQSPPPSKQTTSVPLKKETVRVTLKAADSPPAVPMAVPVRPPVPGAPPVPPPTASSGAVRPPIPTPAPTVALRSVPAPAMGGPAPTIRLATNAPASAPGLAVPRATLPLVAPTQALGSPAARTSRAPTLRAEVEEEVVADEGLSNILAGVGLLAAVIVLVFQIMTANTWIDAVDMEPKGDWGQLLN